MSIRAVFENGVFRPMGHGFQTLGLLGSDPKDPVVSEGDCQMTDGECQKADSEIRVWDKIAILSHEVMDPAEGECQVLTDDGPLPKSLALASRCATRDRMHKIRKIVFRSNSGAG